MADERQFLKLLTEITEVARTNNNSITIEEINDYFEELNLNESQMEAIYDYLCKGHITVTGYAGADRNGRGLSAKEPDNSLTANSDSTIVDKSSAASSSHTTAYRKKVRELDDSSKHNLDEIHSLLSLYESEEIIELAIHAYLPTVINIASKYTNRGVHVDELIQEGNLALVMAVKELAGNTAINDYEKYIRNRIRESMISIIDAEIENDAALAAAMGKAGLVYEASKQLAESMGKVATLRELSEFTHIPEEEIEDIVKFSGYMIKYSK